MKKDEYEVNIGLPEKDREKICTFLQKLLASSYALYVKTHNFHWNVTGPAFYGLHLFFEKQYEELAEAVDEIAERIRALGFFSEGSFSAFSRLSFIKDETDVLSHTKMIKQLLEDHEALIRFLKESCAEVEKLNDGVTADLINARLSVHEKTSWMLRSVLTTG